MIQDSVLDKFTGSATPTIGGRLAILRPALAAVLVGGGYYVGARIGFALTFAPHPISTLWPPNSILLAALVLAPYRWWWFLLLAALPVHLLIELQSGLPLPMILCWFISNSSEALIGAFCLRFLNKGAVRFDSIRQVAILVFVALFAPFVSSFLDAGFVILNRFGTSSYWQVWRMRFPSNVLAEVIIVPLIIMWTTDRLSGFRRLSPGRWLETIAMAFGLLTVSAGAFSWSQAGSNAPALLYAPVPFLLWAAVRFGPKGVNISLALVAFLASWNAIHARGPFIAFSPEENALSIQIFLILIAMPLMFLAAVIQELGRAQEKAQENEEQLKMALNAAQMGTWDWHIREGEVKWSNHSKRMFGLSPADPEVPPEVFYSMMHPEDRPTVEQAINRSLNSGTPYEAEFRMTQADGSVRWIHGMGQVLFDDQGKPMRMIGMNADVTVWKDTEAQLLESHSQLRVLAGRLINAQEEERRRVSYELHDDLNQRVATLSLAISRLRRLPLSHEEIIPHLNELYKQTNDLSNDIRQLSHRLHPATLEHLGLAEALHSYIGEFEIETGILTSFGAHITSETIPSEITVCLYRIALEALRNVARHSQAKAASVLLEEHEQVLMMKVEDSGIGFNVATARRGSGLGLISAQESVNLLQGTFEVTSAPAKGTRLTAKIPLR